MTTSQTDEFSFPTTATGFESPPLWRLSPAASPHHHHHHRRSFSHAAEYSLDSNNHDGGEKKMDMLWEDFNEEELVTSSRSPRVHPVGDRRGLSLHHCGGDGNINYKRSSAGVMVDVGCVEGRLRLSPKRRSISTSTSTGGGTKPGLVVLVKVLKRLFLLHHHKHSAASRRPSPAAGPVKVKISRSSW